MSAEKLSHQWTWVIDRSYCLSDSKRKRETFEFNAIPVFSRPPSVPTLPLKLPPATGHGLINSTQQKPCLTLCWKRHQVGFIQGGRHHPRLLFTYADSSSAQGHPSPQRANKSLTFWDFCFGLGCFFCCPEFSASVQTKGPSFLRKKGLRLGTGERDSQGQSLTLLVWSFLWQSSHWERQFSVKGC